MAKYNVCVPVFVWAYKTVEAGSEEEAIDKVGVMRLTGFVGGTIGSTDRDVTVSAGDPDWENAEAELIDP